MKLKWEVDDANIIEAKLGGFGKKSITANGIEIPNRLTLRKKNEFQFSLRDGRRAAISVTPQFATPPKVELRIDGHLMIDSRKDTIKCSTCEKTVKPNDRFCAACGEPLPTAEHYVHQRQVAQGTGTIKGLAVLFLVSGILMFFVTKSQVSAALEKLNGMSPDTVLSGAGVTVAALRNQLVWAPWGVLIVNLILAAVMVGLAIWGKRAPLAAVLVATATYCVVIVVNAIIDPASIGQGIYVKIVVIAFLVKGIKSALALRTANA